MPPLPSRPLGTTGLTTTRLGLGLAALGRPGYVNLGHGDDLGPDKSEEALADRCLRMLDHAASLGIGYVDVARSYGLAEAFLARWLAERKPTPRPLVGSKWGYAYTAGFRVEAAVHEAKEHSLARFEAQLRESRALLGGDLRLYQIHSATTESGVLANGEVLDALGGLRDEGVVVGLSTSGVDQAETIRKALGITRGGAPLFGCVQATWNLLEPSAGEALAEAHARGVGVLVKEGVANGRLAGRGDDPAASWLAAEAERLGTRPDVLALAAALAEPWVDVVLSGAATPEQLESNVLALSVDIARADVEGMGRLAEPPATYWGKRRALAWN